MELIELLSKSSKNLSAICTRQSRRRSVPIWKQRDEYKLQFISYFYRFIWFQIAPCTKYLVYYWYKQTTVKSVCSSPFVEQKWYFRSRPSPFWLIKKCFFAELQFLQTRRSAMCFKSSSSYRFNEFVRKSRKPRVVFLK